MQGHTTVLDAPTAPPIPQVFNYNERLDSALRAALCQENNYRLNSFKKRHLAVDFGILNLSSSGRAKLVGSDFRTRLRSSQ
jgi:hypothetical protein